MKYTKYISLAMLGASLMFSSCSKDFLDVDYTNGATEKTLKDADPDKVGKSSLLGMYTYNGTFNNGGHDTFGLMSTLHATDLMSGDMVMLKLHWFRFDYAMDNREEQYRRTNTNWILFYSNIATANAIIDQLEEGPRSNGSLAQAYAMRAMSYDYLIQLYQKGYTGPEIGSLPGVPMYFSKREGIENKRGRNTVKDVLDQATKDFEKAVALIKGYARPNKAYMDDAVVNGLSARHYLLIQEYQKAYDAATAALKGQVITSVTPNDLAKGNILENRYMSIEEADWMWGFPIDSETSGVYASFFSHISNLSPGYAGLGYAPRAIDAKLYSLIPNSDVRKSLYDPKSLINYKFGADPNFTQDLMYMRSPEMVLIQAEALAHMGKNTEAAEALKVLMSKRDPEWNANSVTVEDVYLQRRIELWGEGFAYFDMKRLGIGRNSNYEGSNHPELIRRQTVVPAGDVLWTYKIPRQEMQENKSLKEEDQNP